MKATIVDVAKKANVSVATVSRVMNENYPVSAKTKAKVQKAIKALDFIPNIQASEIKKRKTKTIGVIVPSVENMFFPEVINGIEQYLMQESYSLILCFSKNSKEKEQECVHNLLSRNVAGIIIADANTVNVANGYFDKLSRSTPIVFINGDASKGDFSYVMCDEQDGAKRALNALWEHQHEDIYFLRGGNSYSYDVKQKVYEEFLDNHQIANKKHVIDVGEGNSSQVIEDTYKIMLDKLSHNSCTAAFCCNDLMAVGMLKACKEARVKVPQDFSIIGFDNIILSTLVEPKITTVDQNMYQLGNQAARLILSNIVEEQVVHKKVILNASMVMRDTLAKRKES